MSNAGVLGAVVTTSAPADGSPTDKRKGYHWFEYGGIGGVCGAISNLNQGQLLNVSPIWALPNFQTAVLQQNPFDTAGFTFSDTKVVSFTFAFTRFASPNVGLRANIIYIAGTGGEYFVISMNSDGHITIRGRNAAGATILNVLIRNNTATFADNQLHFIASVIDLSDVENREIFHNNQDITDEANWVTWTTYTDDIMPMEDFAGNPDNKRYGFGFDGGEVWGSANPGYNGVGDSTTDGLGYLTFDDACTLISASVWDSDGNVLDPQGDATGWYLSQPQVAFLPFFYKNSGKTGPATYKANTMESNWEELWNGSNDQIDNLQDDTNIVNLGIGGTT